MRVDRRSLFKIGGALVAEAVIIPTDDQVKRFWRGWGGPAKSTEDASRWVTTGWFEASMPPFTKELRPWQVVQVDREIMLVDGQGRLLRGMAGSEVALHMDWTGFKIIGVAEPQGAQR